MTATPEGPAGSRTCQLVGSHVFNSSDEGPQGCVYCGASEQDERVRTVDPEVARALARARWQHVAAPVSHIAAAMLAAEEQGLAARRRYADRLKARQAADAEQI